MYKVKLEHFEGPLDLLLFFIKRDELDIYDIPISYITKEFISYIGLIGKLDLEIAGDFILMASTLMQIKARMLLPREVDEKGEEIDPRADLVKALLEYKRYKEVTEELSYMEATQRNRYYRGYFSEDEKETTVDYSTFLKNITIYDLIKAFKQAILDRPKEVFHEIKKINVTIDEQMVFILDKIKEKPEVSFLEVIYEMHEKIRIVVTFVALLELVKSGKLGVRESYKFNDFVLYGIDNGQNI